MSLRQWEQRREILLSLRNRILQIAWEQKSGRIPWYWGLLINKISNCYLTALFHNIIKNNTENLIKYAIIGCLHCIITPLD